MAFNHDFDVKDQVKRATDIVHLIGSDLTLRRQGKLYVGHCPWHPDESPSFQVDPNRQSWVCYPCSIRGDAFDFVMRREGVDFRQALEILAQAAGIALNPNKRKVEKGSPEDKQTLYAAMAWVEQEYHQFLLNSDAAIPVREYLAERKISAESIEQFKVGFAPLSWNWLTDRARHTQFSPAVLEACGLVLPNKSGGWYDRFRGRVLFPIQDTRNRCIALGGRVVPGLYAEGEEPPGKYYNSAETRLFSKSQNLYALNLARDYLQQSRDKVKRLTIVEGYTDVVAAWQNGLKNVVAALGTAINEQHVQLIKRFADGITLVLDGDDAGQNKMNSVLDLFVAHNVDLRILSLPEGLDPFDFLMANGGDAFQAMVDGAPDAIAHKINIETAGIDLVNDTHRANQALENVLRTLANVPARLLQQSAEKSMRQEQMIMRLARQFSVPAEQVRRRLSEIRSNARPLPGVSNYTAQAGAIAESAIDYAKLSLRESALLELLIQSPDLLDQAVEKVAPDDFEPGPLRELFEQMGEFFHDGTDVGYEQLMLEIESPRLKALVDYLHDHSEQKRVVAESSKIEVDLNRQLDSIIDSFQQRHIESGNQQKISRLYGRDLDDQEEASTLEELFRQQLEKQKRKL